MKMKKLSALLMSGVLAASALVGCGDSAQGGATQTDSTAQTQTAQAQQPVQATTPVVPAVAAAVKNFTDKNGTTHTFTMDEWNYLISVWAYTGQGEEMVTHHTIGDLMAVLAARG